MSDEEIIQKVGDLFSKMEDNQRLYQLAKANGLDVKNIIELTDDAKDNYAVFVVSLLLARREHDVHYDAMVRAGVKNRSLKTAIVNTYKAKAQELIARYKSPTNNVAAV